MLLIYFSIFFFFQMTILIKCTEIPYLSEEIIEKFQNVTIISAEGMKIKMNSLILCAMSDLLRMAFHEGDEDHTIITEFSLEELNKVRNFCTRGSSDAMSESILDVFGLIKIRLPKENNKVLNTEELIISENSNSNPGLVNSVIKTELLAMKNEIIDIKEEPLENFEFNRPLESFSDDDTLTPVEKPERNHNNKVKKRKLSPEDGDENSKNSGGKIGSYTQNIGYGTSKKTAKKGRCGK